MDKKITYTLKTNEGLVFDLLLSRQWPLQQCVFFILDNVCCSVWADRLCNVKKRIKSEAKGKIAVKR